MTMISSNNTEILLRCFSSLEIRNVNKKKVLKTRPGNLQTKKIHIYSYMQVLEKGVILKNYLLHSGIFSILYVGTRWVDSCYVSIEACELFALFCSMHV